MKRITALLLTLLLLLGLTPALAADVRLSSQALTVDGQSRSCDYYNIDGSNYFKLRDIALLLNGTGSSFSVTYDEKTTAIRVTTGEGYTPVGGELETGKDRSSTAVPSVQPLVIDGTERSDLKAYNIGGNNYFQLRDLGKALNFGVNYDEESRTIRIESAKEHGPVTPRLELTGDAGREYLDKIVFLGDSTTYGIGYYYRKGYTDLCPPSQVWTPKSGTMSLWDYDTATIVYPDTGKEILIQDAAKAAQPEILLITLGVNGISSLGEEEFKADYAALVKNILAVSPDTKIILNSIYPVADSWKYQKSINNKKITAANGWIEDLAGELGLRYLHTFETLAVDGKLPESAHNGDGLHLTGETFGKVMTYIRTHALPEYAP
jgi:lysophospholipase L1-like esterase